ncbi:MAG TPA: hypothetical protein V6C82_06405 [Chroococcales cyanobacterium]
MIESLYLGKRLERPQSVRSAEWSEGCEGIEGDNFLAVIGPFGFSGIYPLSGEGKCALHCSLYFLKMAPTDGSKSVVTENTHYWLKYKGTCFHDEELCGVCLDGACPPNKNPLASDKEGRPGIFTLSLE